MESGIIVSKHLQRKVLFDIYKPAAGVAAAEVLFFNDGQDLRSMNFSHLLTDLQSKGSLKPLIVVGIHAGKARKQEYGVAGIPDYEGRGAKAGRYSDFILQEFLPHLKKAYQIDNSFRKAFAGFSLGGLSALDLAWNYPDTFSKTGIFSGSLWWRSKSLLEDYDDQRDRIMHQQIKNKPIRPELKFFLECGAKDEMCDRNGNGIIDSIDDTLDLIILLKEKGYQYPGDITYWEVPEGHHSIGTWKNVLPVFLQWGWAAGT